MPMEPGRGRPTQGNRRDRRAASGTRHGLWPGHLAPPASPPQHAPPLHHPPLSPPPIRRIWIEEGCISCQLCSDLVPPVFLVEGDQTCVVKPDAGASFGPLQEDIEQAARDCPVEVIKIEHGA